MPAAAIAIPAIIGAGSSVASAVIGGRAAGQAAQIQSQAGNQAADDLLKVIAESNPELAKAMEEATAGVTGAAETAASGIESAGSQAAAGVNAATGKANELLDPYIKAGSTAVDQLGQVANEKFQFSQDDPSYQFRMNEGLKALQRSGAARGIVSGGAPLKAALRYGQDYASTEYDKAFNRFMQGQSFKAGTLGQLAGLGQSSATAAGTNLTGAARYAGDIGFDTARTAGGLRTGAAEFGANARMTTADRIATNRIEGTARAGELRTGAAAAQAAGKVGRANAITGALQGGAQIASDIGGYYTLKDLLKNPATRRSAAVNV